MINTDAEAIAAKHVQMRATRDAFAAKLVTALNAAGFTTTSAMPTQDWASGLITIKSAKHTDFENSVTFEIRSASRWSRSVPEKLVLVYATNTKWMRGDRTRYQKLTDELITKLVGTATESLENVIRSANYKNEQEQLEAHYAQVKKQQLAGVVLPPGTEVKINASKDDTYAGKYFINFERHSDAITGKPLTAEQVKKLLAVLNEIQGTAEGWAIIGKHGQTGERVIRGQYGFYTNETTPKFYPTREAAEKDLEYSIRDFANKESVEIVPYASLMTI